ncbi:MAG: hypothetical protein QM734_05325 [Cyclobacteriaceae bacterium]
MKYFITFFVEFLALIVNLVTLTSVCIRISKSFRYQVLLVYYLIASALIARTLLFEKVNNANIYAVLYLITGLSLAYYFFSLFTASWKRAIAVGVGVGVLTYYISSLRYEDIIFDSVGFAITSMGIVLLIFLYLHQVFTHITDEPLFHRFDFWYICSLLIYHLGSFAIFLTFHRLVEKIMDGDKYSSENRAILTYLWGIHNVLLFLGALLTASGLLWIIYRKKSPLY